METNELLYDDLHFIIRHLPKDLVSLMKQQSLILAGGCVRSLVSGEPISDYDLFGPTKKILQDCATTLAEKRKGRTWNTQNAYTVLAPPRTPVQFIFRWLHTNAQELAQSFDFTICQAAVWWQPDPITGERLLSISISDHVVGGGQWKSWVSPRFCADLAARRLFYTRPDRNEDAGGSMLRVVKFLRKGYNISPESLAKVIARLTSRINPETFVAQDGEVGMGRVITSLLREVDPLTVVDGLEVVDDALATDPEPDQDTED